MLAAVLTRAGLGAGVDRLIAYSHASPRADVLVAAHGEALVGGVCCASFGLSGWVGALGVLPAARGRGAGEQLARAAVARLGERGVRTVQLLATDMGRPIYERLGFVAEGEVSTWRGRAGVAPAEVALRSPRDADRPALYAFDRAATGERRDAVLDTLRPLRGVIAERAGAPTGWAASSPWGGGIAVCAVDAPSGVALMAAAAGDEGGALVVPDANEAAVAALRGWGMTRAPAARRMRLGPALGWRPALQFGLFNLFWG